MIWVFQNTVETEEIDYNDPPCSKGMTHEEICERTAEGLDSFSRNFFNLWF
jgi:hypothetical protein